ncbi:HesA/MoeB/ThiF family protein [Olivibacter sp. SDN3]|uniref:HesA/MoeB/ThiF family protein n=1 Tax=Olivibacter sp. SDN3 TaxID=2764720 RepID=UPI001650E97B|nr:HesA/MoeB/ThiF family protein [Olivibacter sp. SDN3]QNL50157.1 HesA/MoeB/ThiF family protein [Olivibacter sp. SDN3]
MKDHNVYARYHRQLILDDFGIDSQRKLLQAKVLIIGAGGLGCPILLYMTAAGVGQIGVADNGLVELSNLHRQVIYTMEDIGKPKVDCCKSMLNAINPDVTIRTYPYLLDNSNLLDLIAGYDLIIDGTDNFQAKYMINDACALMAKPLVYGAVSRYEGQVAVFMGGINYRDIFPHPPQETEVLNCSEAGVLGILPGIIGNLMANECIKLLTGVGEVLTGSLLTYDARRNTFFTIAVTPTALGKKLLPKNRATFETMDYHYLCNKEVWTTAEIGKEAFVSLLEQEEVDVVDIREIGEQPNLTAIAHLRIPLSTLAGKLSMIKRDTVVFVCQSGKRSLQAVKQWEEVIGQNNKKVYSLKGGIHTLL